MDTNETTLYTAILITGFIIGAIIIYFAASIFRSHRQYFKTLRQQFLVEMELLERERNRIARDLHDELGPLLAIAKIQAETTTGATETEQKQLKKTAENIESVTKRLSGISKNLSPRILECKGLETALNDVIDQYRDLKKMQLHFKYQIKRVIQLPESLQIFRIVQELLHNALKHSEAKEVLIQLNERKRKLYIYYQDDGIGIDKSVNEEKEGFGLDSLRRRAEMLGGKMRLLSKNQEGVEYFFELPITVK